MSLLCHNFCRIFLQINNVQDLVSKAAHTQNFFPKDSDIYKGAGTRTFKQESADRWKTSFPEGALGRVQISLMHTYSLIETGPPGKIFSGDVC
jgi:hypothetical protein